MSQTVVGCSVVITHSQSLVERDLGEDASKALIAMPGRDMTCPLS